MGRPLNKRFFAKGAVGPTAAGKEIKVNFHDGSSVTEGYIKKQTGSKRFVCKTIGSADGAAYEFVCVLVGDKLPSALTAGEMSISVQMDDSETYTVTKIAGRKVTLSAPSATGANTYDGASVAWGFDNYTDQAQVEEAGDDNTLVGTDDDDFTEDA